MNWILNDGTIVALGGVVTGPSQFAERLRARIAEHLEYLDLEDVTALDRWIRHEAAQAGVVVVSQTRLKNPVDIAHELIEAADAIGTPLAFDVHGKRVDPDHK